MHLCILVLLVSCHLLCSSANPIGPLSCHIISKPVIKVASYEVTMKQPLAFSTINVPKIQPTTLVDLNAFCQKSSIAPVIPITSSVRACSSSFITSSVRACPSSFITVTSMISQEPIKDLDVEKDHVTSSASKSKKKSKLLSTVTDTYYETSTKKNSSATSELSKASKHAKTATATSKSKTQGHSLSTITDTFYDTSTFTSRSPKTHAVDLGKGKKGSQYKKSQMEHESFENTVAEGSNSVTKSSSSDGSGGFMGFFKNALKSSSAPSTITPSRQ